MELSQLSVSQIVETGQSADEAKATLNHLHAIIESSTELRDEEVWRRVSKEVLLPDQPFALHQLLFNSTYAHWNTAEKGPPPVWIPTPQGAAKTNLARFMKDFQGNEDWLRRPRGDLAGDFQLLQRISFEEPECFWPPVLEHLRIRFAQQPTRVLQSSLDPDRVRWLPGARLNIAECALWGGDPDSPAVLWASEGTPTDLQSLSLGQLRARACHVAAALQHAGYHPGDAIAIDMPMTVESVVIYLGVVLAGCAVVSIADSFVASEIASRLRISRAKAIFTQDIILRAGKSLPLYSRVLEAKAPTTFVIPADQEKGLQVRLRRDDRSWADFLSSCPAEAAAELKPHTGDAYDTTNILFSSGTTGEPKAIPWSAVSPMRCGAEAWAHQDVRQGDAVAWPTNLGWMMGPWLVYAALLNGAAICLYQGSPLGRDFGEFVARARVTMLGLVPSIVRTWRSTDCMCGLDWSSVRCYSSTGEASAPEDYHWLSARAGYKPVIEHCGGTEIAGGFLSGSLLQPQSASTFSTPTIGTHLVLLAADGTQSPHGRSEAVTGELALIPPLLGSSQSLMNRDHYDVYYKGMPKLEGSQAELRRHGDEMQRLPGGLYAALGRTDDNMNLGGIKVSSVDLERVCMQAVSRVSEAAAVGVPAPGGGPERLVMFIVLQKHTLSSGKTDGAHEERGEGTDSEVILERSLIMECQTAISSNLNPLFRVHRVVLRDSLPRTASNKVMRRLLRDELRSPKARL